MISSSDEFGLAHADFMYIQEVFQLRITFDAMASFKNRRAEQFVSVIPQPECTDVNIFNYTLKAGEVYYIHPPCKLIQRVLNKILLYSNIKVILVIPAWVSKPWFTCLLQQGHFKSFVKSYLLFNPMYVSFARNSMFSGKKVFNTLVLYINTAESHSIPCPLF